MVRLILVLAICGVALGQDRHEALGPKDNPKAKGVAPLLDLMATLPAAPRPGRDGGW